MILNVCYNDSCLDFVESIVEDCRDNFPEIIVKLLNEDHFQEKKKAYKLKGGYSARMTPFMLLTSEDNSYIKAFYSEDNGCTIDKFDDFLNIYNGSKNN